MTENCLWTGRGKKTHTYKNKNWREKAQGVLILHWLKHNFILTFLLVVQGSVSPPTKQNLFRSTDLAANKFLFLNIHRGSGQHDTSTLPYTTVLVLIHLKRKLSIKKGEREQREKESTAYRLSPDPYNQREFKAIRQQLRTLGAYGLSNLFKYL